MQNTELYTKVMQLINKLKTESPIKSKVIDWENNHLEELNSILIAHVKEEDKNYYVFLLDTALETNYNTQDEEWCTDTFMTLLDILIQIKVL